MAEKGNNGGLGGGDFLPQFKAIGQSLKKRFFRKPNVADAAEQYEELAKELEREEELEFAGICTMEAARCQETLQSHIPQANLLLRAAKLFLDDRHAQKYFEIDVKGPEVELATAVGHQGIRNNLMQAVQCLEQAATLYKKQGHYGLTLLIYMEAGEHLYKDKSYGEALRFFKLAHALSKAQFTYADQLVVLESVLKCKIKTTDYESVSKIVGESLSALGQPNRRAEIPPEFLQRILHSFEILRVLLALILGIDSADMISFIWPDPTPSQVAPDQLVDHGTSSLMLELKSLVLAVQYGSTEEINTVRNNIFPHLTESHLDLFQALLQMQI